MFIYLEEKNQEEKMLIHQSGFKFLFMLSLIDATLLVQFCIMFISFYVNLLGLEEKK
jgi:hypothetical protein